MFDYNEVELEKGIINSGIGCIVLVTVLYLTLKHSKIPLKNGPINRKLSKITAVTVYWAMSRFLTGFFILYAYVYTSDRDGSIDDIS